MERGRIEGGAGRNRQRTLLVLDLLLDILDGVGRLNLEGDGLAGEGLHEDLHCWLLVCSAWLLGLWFYAFGQVPFLCGWASVGSQN